MASLTSNHHAPPDAPASFFLKVRTTFWLLMARVFHRIALERRRTRSRWRVLGDAEAALFARKNHKAQRLLEPYLANHPDDVDAWVLLTAARENDDAIIEDLEKIPNLARKTPILGMMLAVAHARKGNQPKAFEWAQVADQDPHVSRTLRSQPDFQRVQITLDS